MANKKRTYNKDEINKMILMYQSGISLFKIREILKKECSKALKSTKIDYLDQLNKSTNAYYYQLQKLNYETNN